MAKLQRSDLFLGLSGLVGLVAVVLLYKSAFPLALVEMEITRDEAVEAASEFLEEQGADLAGFRQAALFAGDTEALVFLQRNLGDDEAGRWAREEVPVWRWDIRWFRPQEAEEWLAEVGVDGQIVAFRHVVEEAAPGGALEEAAARRLAVDFLNERGLEVSRLEEVTAVADRKDNRVDHLFVWKVAGSDIVWSEGDPEAGTGYARISVRVVGDRVGGYVRSLRVPEDFSREFQGVLGVGQFLAVASIVLTVLLTLAAMVIAIMRYRVGAVDWRTALIAGAVVGSMFAISIATNWPQAQFSYQTEIPWAVFVGSLVLGLVLLSIFYVVFVTFPTAAGASLAREYFPDSIKGFADAMRGRVFTSAFATDALRGYALAAAFLGYFTAFYWFAQRWLGAWMPAEGPYSQIFNNALPFLTPLTISLVAAVSEETIYRLFGISLFRKLTRSTFLALLIPAAIWAFGHSNYPVFPVYIRGIELTIAGVLFGLAFLRYGLVACIVAHYVIDAVALGLPLVTSANTTYIVSGLIVIGLAAVPGMIGLLSGRRNEGDTALDPRESPA